MRDNKTNCETYYISTYIDGIDVIFDSLLGLYWQKNASELHFNWEDSKDYCSSLGTNWRLPTLVEIELSLIDINRQSSPFIIGGNGYEDLFSNIENNSYWTNSRFDEFEAYRIIFDLGDSNKDTIDSNYPVLCVRESSKYNDIWNVTQKFFYNNGLGQQRIGEEFMSDSFICGGNETILDTITNLCWEKSPPDIRLSWTNSVNRCEDLNLSNGSWRLPDKAELMTLIVHNGSHSTSTALNSIGFEEIQNDLYWSNSIFPLNPQISAYGVRFNTGSSFISSKSNTRYSLCVKSLS